MMSLHNFLAFALTTVVIVAVPGPSVLFTVNRALTLGRKTALFTVAGNSSGVCLQVLAAAFGMGTLVQHSALAFAVLKYLGAAYVVYLGVQAIRKRRSVADAVAARVDPVLPLRALREGAIVGATNPKTAAVFVTIMPGFAMPSAGNLTVQLLILGALFPLAGLLLDSIWATLAGAARAWVIGSPKRLAAIGGSGGLAMIGLGASLAFTGRKD